MTNREWLESLSDNKLAKHYKQISASCQCCFYYEKCRKFHRIMNCVNGYKKWLQAEHEGDKQ